MRDLVFQRHEALSLRWDNSNRLLLRRGLEPKQVALPPRAVALVHAFDGRRTVAEALESAGFGDEGLGLVETLQTMGALVTPEEAQAPTPTGPRVSHRIEVSGREALILDGLATEAEQQSLFEALESAEFARLQHSTEATSHLRRFSLEVELENFRSSWLHSRVQGLLVDLFPREDFYVSRIYADCLLPSDTPVIHTDCWPVDRDLTLVYSACPRWAADWGGETVIYDDDEDGRLPVVPRPGRGALFRGALRHGARPPTALAELPRYTLAIKMRSVPRGAPTPDLPQARIRPHLEPKLIF
ncbi:MAG: 2OG-Fe(II) oxygenase [Bradymonadia bacterium]